MWPWTRKAKTTNCTLTQYVQQRQQEAIQYRIAEKCHYIAETRGTLQSTGDNEAPKRYVYVELPLEITSTTDRHECFWMNGATAPAHPIASLPDGYKSILPTATYTTVTVSHFGDVVFSDKWAPRPHFHNIYGYEVTTYRPGQWEDTLNDAYERIRGQEDAALADRFGIKEWGK